MRPQHIFVDGHWGRGDIILAAALTAKMVIDAAAVTSTLICFNGFL